MRRITLALAFVFLYLPIGTIMAYSFNDSKRNVVWHGFTFKYYLLALTDRELLWALANSLSIAFFSACICLILGVTAAYALWRFRFPFYQAFNTLLVMPIVVPEVCMGIAMMVFFTHIPWLHQFPWPFDLVPIIIAHVAFSFPFVTIVARTTLESLHFELIEAAFDLGANESQFFWHIVLPHMRAACIAGFLLAVALSLDDFLITFFTTRPGTATLPLKIYAMVRFAISPEVNAISTILLGVTFILALFGLMLQRQSTKARQRTDLQPSDRL